jgi:hypothetical protein
MSVLTKPSIKSLMIGQIKIAKHRDLVAFAASVFDGWQFGRSINNPDAR